MNLEYFLIFLIILTGLILLVQRTTPSKRRLMLFVLILPAILLRNFAQYRDVETEALTAFWVALFLNYLFWVFVGRHLPEGGTEDIKVLGLDD
jgi:cytochrome b561